MSFFISDVMAAAAAPAGQRLLPAAQLAGNANCDARPPPQTYHRRPSCGNRKGGSQRLDGAWVAHDALIVDDLDLAASVLRPPVREHHRARRELPGRLARPPRPHPPQTGPGPVPAPHPRPRPDCRSRRAWRALRSQCSPQCRTPPIATASWRC